MMFTYKRRVKFYETDGMRVVHHANYLRYFEEARVEYLRAGGIDLNDLMKEGIVFPPSTSNRPSMMMCFSSRRTFAG